MSKTRKRGEGKKPAVELNHKGFRRHIKLELKQGRHEDLPEAPRPKTSAREWAER